MPTIRAAVAALADVGPPGMAYDFSFVAPG